MPLRLPPCPLLLLLLLLLLLPTAAQLTLRTWPNAAFGPSSSATVSTVPSANLSLPALADFSSLRLEALLTWPSNASLTFFTWSSGGTRVWVGGRLVIDAGAAHGTAVALTSAFTNVTLVGGTPVVLRLEYSHWTGGPPGVCLLWAAATGGAPPALVPANSLSPTLPAAESARQAMRDRMEERANWQTWYQPSLLGHMHMPSGVVMDLTVASADEVLYPLNVFRQFNPAGVVQGLHSPDGSNYTELTVRAWRWRACDMLLRSTVTAAGALLLHAAANGSDCSPLSLLLTPRMARERPGASSMSEGGGSFTASAARGFAALVARPLAGCAAPALLPWANISGAYLALPLMPRGEAGFVIDAGSEPPPDLGQAGALIDAARHALVAAANATYGALGETFLASVAAARWNTIFVPQEGVFTVVGRTWDFGGGYVRFVWDNLLLAWQLGMEAGQQRDVAYQNIIQVVLGRTSAGFPPNWGSASASSADRSEPQLGAQVLLRLYRRWGDTWLVELLFEPLLAWAEWVWESRRGWSAVPGSGSDGRTDLVSLGSDPVCCDSSANTLQGARYESGLDNSPMYDLEAALFNESSHLMGLLDVGASALLVAELEALSSLAGIAGRPEVLPTLAARSLAISAALNAHAWDEAGGTFANVFAANGSLYPRMGPPVFFPLLTATAVPPQRAARALAALTSPAGLCVNLSHAPLAPGGAPSALLSNWVNLGYTHRPGGGDHAACVTDECIGAQVRGWFDWLSAEAVVLAVGEGAGTERDPPGGTRVEKAAAPARSPPVAGALPLLRWFSPVHADTVTTTSSAGLDATYELRAQEGWCLPAPPPASGGWSPTRISLHRLQNSSFVDLHTCGSEACRVAAVAAGYAVLNATMCWGWGVTLPPEGPGAPCRFGGLSIARDDPAFADQAYWRGRVWGPHLAILFWALQAQGEGLPAAVAARADLVAQGADLFATNWRLFGFTPEHSNGVVGVYDWTYQCDPCEWGARGGMGRRVASLRSRAPDRTSTLVTASSLPPHPRCTAYTWGALPGFLQFVEAGFYG